MPWKDEGPPKESNYDITYKQMISSEKTLRRKDCLEVIQDEVQKPHEQGFVKGVPPEQINHKTPEWYLPQLAVFTPDRTTKVRLVFDASAQGHDGKSLNDHLEKGANYINSFPNVIIAWGFDKEVYTGDIHKMFSQVKIHPDDQVLKRLLPTLKKKSIPRLELMGCLSLAKLYSTCKEALEFTVISNCKKVFWTGSQTVLTWLKTFLRKFKPFVSVRVAEIQETISSEMCKYIRSDNNPADVLMRGTPPEKLKTWPEGPPFLKRPQPEWPKFEENPKESGKELSDEMKLLNKFEAANTYEQVFCSASSRGSNDNPILEHLM